MRNVDIAGPTHYRWGPMSNAEDVLMDMVQQLRESLNEITDRNIFYEHTDPNLKKAYDDAKAANNGRLLNPPLDPAP